MSEFPVSRRQILQGLSLSLATTLVAAFPRSVLAQEAPTGTSPTAESAVPAEPPADRRLLGLKDYDGDFPWTPPVRWEDWQQRAEEVRTQVLVACGLWPLPTRKPLSPVVHGKVERDDYTVERVYFESFPGLYVTGSLYRPKGVLATRSHAAVLCPHGHWINGRFHDHGAGKVASEIELDAEQFPIGGRHPVQARCVHLARMGATVFLYDMIGYADNTCLSQDLVHGFQLQQADLSSPERWGLFSAQSELRLLNALGLQTWNSLRAMDFLSDLPEVDPTRIGVTGSSGGGTQTFLLGAVDPRPAVFFPVVMVSTAMQGGCTCENASYLRVGTGNIELAALLAPRPLGMAAADDWTRDIETQGLPELKTHYARLGVPDNVAGKHFPFEHNYNRHSRAMMYEFINRWLAIVPAEIPPERDFVPLSIEEATVWSAEHPAPESTIENELKILTAFDQDWQEQWQQLEPTTPERWLNYQQVIGRGWNVLVGRALPGAGEVNVETVSQEVIPGADAFRLVLRIPAYGEHVPAAYWQPHLWNQQLVIWVHPKGITGAYQADGSLTPALRRLLGAGFAVATLDVLYTGEFLKNGQPLEQAPAVPNPRQFVGYTAGYNHPLPAQRTHDVLTLISHVLHGGTEPEQIHVVGVGAAAPWAAAAAYRAGMAVTKLAICSDFRFSTITQARDPQLWPGALKYGDLPGLLALRAPQRLYLSGEMAPLVITQPALSQIDVLTSAYRTSNALNSLRIDQAAADMRYLRLVEWLIGS